MCVCCLLTMMWMVSEPFLTWLEQVATYPADALAALGRNFAPHPLQS